MSIRHPHPRHLRRSLALLLTFLITIAAFGCAEAPAPRLRPVEADAATAARLEALGAQVVADYGAYKLLRADESLLADTPVERRDEYDRILLHALTIDTASPEGAALAGIRPPQETPRLHLVQFAGPVQRDWYKELEETGVRIVTYVPSNTYLVYTDASAYDRLLLFVQRHPAVAWAGDFLDDYKIHPSVYEKDAPRWAIQMVEDPRANETTLAMIRQRATDTPVVQSALGYVNAVAAMSRQEVLQLAARPEVVSILPRPTPRKLGERAALLNAGFPVGSSGPTVRYLDWLAQMGFTQEQFDRSGFGVDVTDSGIDDGTTAPNHFGLYRYGDVRGQSRVVYSRLEGSPNRNSTLQGCDGHGTINAHIIAGYSDRSASPHVDAAGYHYGLGVAPFVRVGASVIFDPDMFTDPDYEDLISRAYRDGMRISSNSWGADENVYDADAQRYDALVRDAQPAGAAVPAAGDQEMVIIFAAGNDGPGARSVGTPATAKNVIAVGAAENVNPTGGDGCGTGDSEANSAFDVASFSSRGPTSDGRHKPDLMAPGTHVAGGVAQDAVQATEPPAYANGRAVACFDGDGVCGSRSSNFYPAGQEWYTISSGTSHSTPVVAGAAALLRQFFLNQGAPPPSPAMTRAWLVASSRYMTGTSANDTLPSAAQGMGLVDLGRAFDGVARMVFDQDPGQVFTATGEVRRFTGEVGDPSLPFRVTLAWTDPPGPTFGNAWRNDLDLRVTVGGVTYKGNVFSGEYSVSGGSADSRNNLESVFLPAGTTGPFTIEVVATNINSAALSAMSGPSQDFALVAYNTCIRAAQRVESVTAAPAGDHRIEISWTENGGAAYRIYRAAAPTGPWERIGQVTSPPFVDENLSGGATWFYVVRAVDCSESEDSPVASATATGACLLVPDFDGISRVENAGSATCTTSLSWEPARPACGGTISYSVYRSTDPAFIPSVSNRVASGLETTSYVDMDELESGVTYHYVVRATETADRATEETNERRLSARPTGPVTEGLRFFDDFDGQRPADADSLWQGSAIVGQASGIRLVRGCRYDSPDGAMRIGAADDSCDGTYGNDQQLVLSLGGADGFTIPADVDEAELSFRLWYDLERRYDGAWLAFSLTSADGPWLDVPTERTGLHPWIVEGVYDDTLYSDRTTEIWTGTTDAFETVRVRLDDLAGEQIWFAWRFHSGTRVVAEGLYLDDVRITADRVATCTTGRPSDKPAVGYRILSIPTAASVGEAVQVDLQAVDRDGALAVGYAGSAMVTSSDPAATLPALVTFSQGAARIPVIFRTAGRQSIVVRDASGLSVTGSIEVLPGSPVGLAIAGAPESLVAGQHFDVRVQVVDAEGNPTGTGQGRVVLGLEGAPGPLLGTTEGWMSNGVAAFTSLRIEAAGTGYVLEAWYDEQVATSARFDVLPGEVEELALTLDETARAGQEMQVVALATDAYGNRTEWNGAATFTSTDPLAILPTDAAFTGGRLEARITFRTGGAQTLEITGPIGHPSGSATVEVQPYAPPTVVILGPADGAVVGGRVQIDAEATVDSFATVRSLAIRVDGETIATAAEDRLSAIWDSGTAAPGSSHRIEAVVEDEAGQIATAAIEVSVKAPAKSRKKSSSGCSAAGGELGLLGLLALLRRRRR